MLPLPLLLFGKFKGKWGRRKDFSFFWVPEQEKKVNKFWGRGGGWQELD